MKPILNQFGNITHIESLQWTNTDGDFVDAVGNVWPLTPRQAFIAWYLMRGGIDGPLRLMELTACRNRIAWNDLFLVIDNMAPRMRLENKNGFHTLALPNKQSVICGGCGHTLKAVPCKTCQRCDYVTHRSDQAYWSDQNTNGYIPVESVVRAHLSAYHGRMRDW